MSSQEQGLLYVSKTNWFLCTWLWIICCMDDCVKAKLLLAVVFEFRYNVIRNTLLGWEYRVYV